MSPAHFISVRGARVHNLKNIDVDIPRNQLVVITGPSGSGKSSLAFDTIYAEGQRRYVESLSTYARQFLEMMQKPDVDQIDGLSPAISIEQKTTSKNPRSTVGTVTEIYDYARLLFAIVGVPHSPATGLPIESQTITMMIDKIMSLQPKTRLFILAPIVRGRKGEYRKELSQLLKQGFQRVKIDGVFHEIADAPALNKKLKHDIDVVVDRIVIQSNIATRLADSIETTLRLASGLLIAEFADEKDEQDNPKRIIFSEKFACPVSGFTIVEIEPRLFSFNSPFGACSTCDGIGTQITISPDLIVPNENISLKDGAIIPWSSTSLPYHLQTLQALAKHFKAVMSDKWKDLPKELQQAILYGTGTEKITFTYDDGHRPYKICKPFTGVIKHLHRRWMKARSNREREEIAQFHHTLPCPACDGYRLKPEALAVKLDGLHIGEICNMSILQARQWFNQLPATLTPKQNEIARRPLKEIQERLRFLNNVGLDYLTLSRNSGSLSGGESQRIRLSSQIGSGLSGVLYVLDEPSIGLHQCDNERLIQTLKHLRELGNTVIVVEHDEDAIMSADHVIDVGPQAGIHGGCIVAHGTPAEIMANPASITGQYLSAERSIAIPGQRRTGDEQKCIRITGACGNNLKNITATFPLGTFICITGVSGSGKSTLLLDTLYQAIANQLQNIRSTVAPYESIQGMEHIDKIIKIDQSPIGRTPRSNPATYTGTFTPVREWFAQLPESRVRGYQPGRFSFNSRGGRCEHCQGNGVIKVEMHFLPDVYVTCDICKGKRYNRETLEILFNGKTIADVLDMTVEEGVIFFEAIPVISSKLQTLQRVGLGYIKIGQQATTISGGEAQRIKLAKELARRATGKTLYILDEPTTGLHFYDVDKLLQVLHELVNQGNTIAVIEHNLEVIKTADWILDLGPKGGDGGGEILAFGPPENIIKEKKSSTARFLSAILDRNKEKKSSMHKRKTRGKK